MSLRRVQPASTGFVNFVESESHLMMDQQQRFCYVSRRLLQGTLCRGAEDGSFVCFSGGEVVLHRSRSQMGP